MLIAAFIINVIMIICEFRTLGHIRGKGNVLKYYTYLQNFIGLIVSLIFCICLIVCTVSGRTIPEFVKGLRYTATCGLLATMLIFITFLGAGKKIQITEDDFLFGYSPKTANIILHYVCPILSLVSFVLFEREIPLSNGVWTGIVAIPSCIYWIIYIVLSATKLWEEPYDFASRGEKNNIVEILTVLLIPLSFIAISFILWNIQ
jgi:hypothetical protein